MSGITDFLIEHKNSNAVSFHMPGHKGRSEIFTKSGFAPWISDMVGNDITEIPGADALFCPRSSIKEVMDMYAALYGAKHTELLVNGSSAGVMASILSVVPRGGKLVLGRNSHHSAYSAMRLGGIRPCYLRPQISRKYGLLGAVLPEEVDNVLSLNPDARAVLITSPNYYGVLSDIEAIAAVCRHHKAILIVDQAHGAHLKFFDDTRTPDEAGYIRYSAAENQKADIVINSTHKTLLSFTGSGILNVMSDRVDVQKLADNLRMLQTTSPSYILMSSLDVNCRIMSRWGSEVISDWAEDLKYFYRRAHGMKGLTVVRGAELDATKINISLSEFGINGSRLDKELRYNGIFSEMVHGDYVMLMTGAGNRREDYVRLIKAIERIIEAYGVESAKPSPLATIPDFVLEPAALPEEKELVPLYRAEGRILHEPIITYPPGSPIACPGERLSYDVIAYISEAIAHGDTMSGVDDEGMIWVGAR